MKSKFFLIYFFLVSLSLFANGRQEVPMPLDYQEEGIQTITLGGGCFWCVEAVFEKIDGIQSAVSGYAGGHVADPGYEAVCTGTTGHAEVVKITYDADIISLTEILNIFFAAHDPTTVDRQGADRGSQYRSIILYGKEEHLPVIQNVIAFWDEKKVYSNPIVTEVEPLEDFYPAEDYHQDFYENNPNYPYCLVVIAPKLEKLGLE